MKSLQFPKWIPEAQKTSVSLDDVISLSVRVGRHTALRCVAAQNTSHLSFSCDANEAQMWHSSGCTGPRPLILCCHVNPVHRIPLIVHETCLLEKETIKESLSVVAQDNSS